MLTADFVNPTPLLIAGVLLLFVLSVACGYVEMGRMEGAGWRNPDETPFLPSMRRLYALGVDMLVFGIPIWAFGTFLAPFRLQPSPSGLLRGNLNFDFASPTSVWGWGALLIGVMVPFTLFEALFAATPGMFWNGLRVTDLEGRRPSFLAVCSRNLLLPVDLAWWMILGGLSMWFSRTNQRLGDRFGHTLVADRDAVTWARTRPRDGRRCWGLAAGLFAATYVVAATVIYFYSPGIAVVPSAQGPSDWTNGLQITVPSGTSLTQVQVTGSHRTGNRVVYRVLVRVDRHKTTANCSLLVPLKWDGGVLNPGMYLFGESPWKLATLRYECMGQRLWIRTD